MHTRAHAHTHTHTHSHTHTHTHTHTHMHTTPVAHVHTLQPPPPLPPPLPHTQAPNLVGAISRANVFAGDDGNNGPALGESCPDGTVPIAARGDIMDVHPHGEAMIL